MFALEITLNSQSLEGLKSEVRRLLPEIKSSHRAQAIGRGLRFSKYESAKFFSENMPKTKVRIDAIAFSEYLKKKGFDVQPKIFLLAGAKVALVEIARKHPNLTVFGMGFGQPKWMGNGRWESVTENYNRFELNRRELIEGKYHDAFFNCLFFLKRVKSTKTIRKSMSSYHIKHIAENLKVSLSENEDFGPKYVPNGILIAAALHAGFRFTQYFDDRGYPSQNVFLICRCAI